MAKLKQGILGGLSGKVGNVVGSSWKGIDVLKSQPLSVANPKTAAQQAQRGKFSNAVAFAKAILTTIIKPLWDRFAVQQSGFNAFLSSNIDLFETSMPSPYADLIMSTGKMAFTEFTTTSTPAGSSSVTINWTDDTGTGLKLATDEAYFLIVNITQEKIYGFANIAVRADGTATVSFDTAVASGDELRLYLAFRRADGTVVSNSRTRTISVG